MKITKTRWIFMVTIFIVVASGVQIVLANEIYLPLIAADPTITPTVTASATPTMTPTATATPTATPDDVILIEEIVNSDTMDPLDEYVSIKNYKSSSVTMTGWFIRDDGEHRYDFPEGFKIGGKKTVRIWTKDGTDTDTDLFWGNPVEVWNDVKDCAYLRDDSEGENELIDVYCYEQASLNRIPINQNSKKIYK